MHIYRTAHEAIIEAPINEIRALCANISTLKVNETRVFTSSQNPRIIPGAEVGSKLVVTAEEGLFFASWKPKAGLIINGNPESIQAFAEVCNFQCEPFPGIHAHWDFQACSALVHDDSLPIVVQLS